MKRLLFIILLFGVCLHVNQAHAQRCLPGMRGIQLTGGLSDNMRWKNGDGFGLPRRDSGEHLHEERPPLGGRCGILGEAVRLPGLPLSGEPVHGEGGYYLNFLSDRKKTFFAALGLSALAGYETVNWGESLLPDGSRLTDEDNFIYGGALTLELSAYVTDKIVLLVNGRQRVLFGGDCGKFHTQVGVGIRFMIR